MRTFFGRRELLKSAAAFATALPAIRNFGLSFASSKDTAVSFDSRSMIVNGKRTLILSGEMHYSRSAREMWPALLDRSKALGLNTIATYVFWNVHEPSRDTYNFSGDADLRHFLELCRERHLNVFLRVGPYCCAEWNFGGFPPYLRDEPDITIRTLNQPYLERVEKFFVRLAAEIKPALAVAGGPVMLIQVENEYSHVAKRYGAAGYEYLKWMVEVANRVGFGAVPLTECEGGAHGAIETGNGDTFPPDKIARFRSKTPNVPLLWSECYPGWYELWGGESHIAPDPRKLAFYILYFIAGGGSGVNYYMWHGGTNFGRTSMYLQATTYDFNAPLDEFGRETLFGHYLAEMHFALAKSSDLLLRGNATRTTLRSGLVQARWQLGSIILTVLLNRTALTITSAEGKFGPRSARVIAADGTTLFDTNLAFATAETKFRPRAWISLARSFEWTAWSEPMPVDRVQGVISDGDPIEQLALTRDQSDYCWYSHDFTANKVSVLPRKLTIPYGGDFFYLFADGKLIDQTATPLHENRGPITPENPMHPRILSNRHEKEVVGFHHEFTIPAGVRRVDLLCTAMGMVKGDWQIASPMNFERKGIWEGVLADGVPLKGWEMRPFLAGELAEVVAKPGQTKWGVPEKTLLTWYRTNFPLPASALASDADFRLDATGLGKGSLFLNGRGLGRHWLILAQGYGAKPTQRYYHVPRAWLREQNELIIFEEQRNTPHDVQLETRSFSTAR